MTGISRRRYELLIFDWDGTLADSAGQIVSSMQGAIATMGLPARTDTQIAELIGLGLPEAFARLFPELDAKLGLQLLEDYGRRFRSTARTVLFPEVTTTLQQLRALGWRLAVATGKSRRGLERALRESGLSEYFVATRCADETASKPDPAMLDALLLATATEPSSALMVGDTEYDMAMAAAIGMDGLGVGCGVHLPERLRAAGALDVISDVRNLQSWLGQREPIGH